jgi:hypothetical protein
MKNSIAAVAALVAALALTSCHQVTDATAAQ